MNFRVLILSMFFLTSGNAFSSKFERSCTDEFNTGTPDDIKEEIRVTIHHIVSAWVKQTGNTLEKKWAKNKIVNHGGFAKSTCQKVERWIRQSNELNLSNEKDFLTRVYDERIENLTPLKEFNHLTKILLRNQAVKEFNPLAKLKNLATLELTNFKAVPKGLNYLKNLTNLSLNVTDSNNPVKLHGRDLVQLMGLPLEKLDLSGNAIKNLPLKFVLKPELRYLSLIGNNNLNVTGLKIKESRGLDDGDLKMKLKFTQVDEVPGQYVGYICEDCGTRYIPDEEIQRKLEADMPFDKSLFNDEQKTHDILVKALHLRLSDKFIELLSIIKKNKDKGYFRQINNKRATVSAEGKIQSTLLIEATKNLPDTRLVVKELLDENVDMSKTDSHGYSAPSYVINRGDFKVLLRMQTIYENSRLKYPNNSPLICKQYKQNRIDKRIEALLDHVKKVGFLTGFNIPKTWLTKRCIKFGSDNASNPNSKIMDDFISDVCDYSEDRQDIIEMKVKTLQDQIERVSSGVFELYDSINNSSILTHKTIQFLESHPSYKEFYTYLAGGLERSFIEANLINSGSLKLEPTTKMKYFSFAGNTVADAVSFASVPSTAGLVGSIFKTGQKYLEMRQLAKFKQQAISKGFAGKTFDQIATFSRDVAVELLEKFEVAIQKSQNRNSANFVNIQDSNILGKSQAVKMHLFILEELETSYLKINSENIKNFRSDLVNHLFNRWNDKLSLKQRKKYRRLLDYFEEGSTILLPLFQFGNDLRKQI